MPTHHISPAIEQVLHSLQQRMPGFRTREAQVEMLQVVSDTLLASEDEPSIAVVEAPCGVGKSVGYAVSGILAGKARELPLVIATGTVALQEQLCNKDLPALQAYGGMDFTFTLVKGRGRYVCPSRLADVSGYGGAQKDMLREDAAPVTPDRPESDAGMYILLAELLGSRRWAGDRDSLPFPMEDAAWRRITNDRHGCLGNGCRFRKECPFYEARDAVRRSDVLVTNHDLLLADLAMGGGSILPEPENCLLVIDEGHNLPERAISHFATETALADDFPWLAKAVSNAQSTAGILEGKKAESMRQDIAELAPMFTATMIRLKQITAGQPEISQAIAGDSAKPVTHRFVHGVLPQRLQEVSAECSATAAELGANLSSMVQKLGELAKSTVGGATTERIASEIGDASGRLATIAESLQAFAYVEEAREPPTARWIEVQPRRGGKASVKLCSSPITASGRLATYLWQRFAAIVSTSATLRTLGSFDRYLRRAGLAKNPLVQTLAVDSPFDFERNGTLVLPPMSNDPGMAEPFTQELISVLPGIIKRGQATLVLFCSRWQMERVASGMPERMRKVLLLQGAEDRATLLNKHSARVDNNESSIIFGLASFAEGLDLPGRLCQHVVITKLPFKVPDSPVEAAIVEWLTKLGRNPFLEVAVPDAALKLTQACGRLLRTETDTGAVTILDRRITRSTYGRMILDSLPPFHRETGWAAESRAA